MDIPTCSTEYFMDDSTGMEIENVLQNADAADIWRDVDRSL